MPRYPRARAVFDPCAPHPFVLSEVKQGHCESLPIDFAQGDRRMWECSLDRAAPGDEMQHDHDHRDHQQQVDQPAGDVEGEKAEQPQHNQHRRDNCKHVLILIASARDTRPFLNFPNVPSVIPVPYRPPLQAAK